MASKQSQSGSKDDSTTKFSMADIAQLLEDLQADSRKQSQLLQDLQAETRRQAQELNQQQQLLINLSSHGTLGQNPQANTSHSGQTATSPSQPNTGNIHNMYYPPPPQVVALSAADIPRFKGRVGLNEVKAEELSKFLNLFNSRCQTMRISDFLEKKKIFLSCLHPTEGDALSAVNSSHLLNCMNTWDDYEEHFKSIYINEDDSNIHGIMSEWFHLVRGVNESDFGYEGRVSHISERLAKAFKKRNVPDPISHKVLLNFLEEVSYLGELNIRLARQGMKLPQLGVNKFKLVKEECRSKNIDALNGDTLHRKLRKQNHSEEEFLQTLTINKQHSDLRCFRCGSRDHLVKECHHKGKMDSYDKKEDRKSRTRLKEKDRNRDRSISRSSNDRLRYRSPTPYERNRDRKQQEQRSWSRGRDRSRSRDHYGSRSSDNHRDRSRSRDYGSRSSDNHRDRSSSFGRDVRRRDEYSRSRERDVYALAFDSDDDILMNTMSLYET